MANWYVIAVIGLAAIVVLSLLYRRNGAGGDRVATSSAGRLEGARTQPDYVKDREDARLAHMSAEDKAWETASLQRALVRQLQEDPLAEQRA